MHSRRREQHEQSYDGESDYHENTLYAKYDSSQSSQQSRKAGTVSTGLRFSPRRMPLRLLLCVKARIAEGRAGAR